MTTKYKSELSCAGSWKIYNSLKSKTEKHVPKEQNKSSEINLKHMEIY